MASAILKHLAGDRVYVASAGVRPGDSDPFAITVMKEIGIDMSQHVPVSLAGVHDTSFDLIVALAPEAYDQALGLAQGYAVDVEYWPTPDPTLATGAREQVLDAYRTIRDGLFAKIKTRLEISGVRV